MGKPKRKTVARKPAVRRTSSGVNINNAEIIKALNNVKYKARTFDGVAKELGASKQSILEKIKKDPSLREQIKIYRRKTSDGRYLVTTKARYSKEASIKDKFVDVFSSSGVKIEDVG